MKSTMKFVLISINFLSEEKTNRRALRTTTTTKAEGNMM